MQALLASYEKNTPLLRLATLLEKNGWTLLGSSGTAKYLNENGISCRDVAEIVGKPILGHRVVTLSRELHAGLLAKPEDGDELKSLGIEPIDLVYVTLYPLEKTAADPSATPDDDIEHWLSDGAKEEERKTLAEKFAAAAERRVVEYVNASATYWEHKTQ